MTERLLDRAEQFAKLHHVAKIAGQAECNFAITIDPAKQMVYLRAVDTPKASRIVHLNDDGYAVWRWQDHHQYRRSETGISAERAAEIIVREYFEAKAKRIQKLYPGYSRKEILSALSKGYQGRPPGKPN